MIFSEQRKLNPDKVLEIDEMTKIERWCKIKYYGRK